MPEMRRRFDEYSTLEYLLLGDLRAALQDSDDADSHRWLTGVVASLVQSLPQKLELTLELDGLCLAAKNAADRDALFGDLHAEQRRLLAELEEIHRRMAESAAMQALLEEVGPRLTDWLDSLAQHNQSLDKAAAPLLQPVVRKARRTRKRPG